MINYKKNVTVHEAGIMTLALRSYRERKGDRQWKQIF